MSGAGWQVGRERGRVGEQGLHFAWDGAVAHVGLVAHASTEDEVVGTGDDVYRSGELGLDRTGSQRDELADGDWLLPRLCVPQEDRVELRVLEKGQLVGSDGSKQGVAIWQRRVTSDTKLRCQHRDRRMRASFRDLPCLAC